jgi:hypothetical protein
MARVVSSLSARSVTEEELHSRAVALGLLRSPGAAEGTELTPRTASRLLLTGYRLPAQVEAGTYLDVRRHVGEGRQVFLLLGGLARAARLALPPVVQVQRGAGEGAGGYRLRVAEAGAAAGDLPGWPLDGVVACWAAGGRLLIVAARCWSDLPAQGAVFFAGGRGPDGVLHWDTAECDTDGEGRILRC